MIITTCVVFVCAVFSDNKATRDDAKNIL